MDDIGMFLRCLSELPSKGVPNPPVNPQISRLGAAVVAPIQSSAVPPECLIRAGWRSQSDRKNGREARSFYIHVVYPEDERKYISLDGGRTFEQGIKIVALQHVLLI
jgi:hypothetical protein